MNNTGGFHFDVFIHLYVHHFYRIDPADKYRIRFLDHGDTVFTPVVSAERSYPGQSHPILDDFTRAHLENQESHRL
jgi:hypothetical protein